MGEKKIKEDGVKQIDQIKQIEEMSEKMVGMIKKKDKSIEVIKRDKEGKIERVIGEKERKKEED